MTRHDHTPPMIDSIVNDLWRSLFGTALDALRSAVRRVAVHGAYAGRVSA
ncbi:MAG: hypothetical protein R3D52_12300 [Xanthobacteraceae bacterium]